MQPIFRLWRSSTQRSHIMQPERILGIYSRNCSRDLFNLRRFSSKDRQSPALLQYDFNLQHYYLNVVTHCCSLRVLSCSSTQTQNQPHRSLKINLNAVFYSFFYPGRLFTESFTPPSDFKAIYISHLIPSA